MIGKTISHYKIIEKLAVGGMGVVYKAQDIKLKRTVALKFLPSSFSLDDDAKQRFIHEAQAASSLDHNNICTIYEIGETEDLPNVADGQLFISMALYEGETLKKKIAKGLIETDEALNIFAQICEGLKKAHQNNIIHRDIKPANIFITNDGIIKILDFGLAKTKGQTQLTQYGSTLGTIDYMSPEQSRGVEVDKRSDIWSLGVMLFEMLTGQLPFKGDYEQAVIYSILNENPDLSKIPKEIIPIIQKATTKSQEERYQKIEELEADLKSVGKKTISESQKIIPRYFGRKITFRTRIILATILTVVTVLYVVYYFNINKNPNNSTNDAVRKMIVVLPFANLGSPDDDYFAQGMREEISNKLAALGSIGVISRNSAEKYAKSDKTTKEIGKELGVDYILEGTVQWAKNKKQESRIRIIPQLVRVSDDVSVWSESFDRVIKDIFEIQNEIAENVVSTLGIKLLLNQSVSGPPPTTNLEAYDYYLKAHKFHYGTSTGANIKTAIKLYEKALELDPNYAAAHAQLSVAYNALFKWYWDRDSLNLKKAARHIEKAQQLNPNIAEIHLAQFFYYFWFTNDEERVFQELKKVIELQPNNAEACLMISGYYLRNGEVELAQEYDSRALQLDPLNARYPWGIGFSYNYYRDYENAEKYLKKAIELGPNTSRYYADLAVNYLDWKGDTKLAWQTAKNIKDDEYLESNQNIFIYLNILDRNFEKALKQLKTSENEYENSYSRYIPNSEMIALVYWYMGKENTSKKYFDSSRVKLEKMILMNSDDIRFSFALCKSYAGMGEKEKAIEELNEAIESDPSWTERRRKYTRSSYLSYIYILTGDYVNAIKQIDFLLSEPTGFSVNILKLDPLYDPLRNLPGYKTIIEKYSVKY